MIEVIKINEFAGWAREVMWKNRFGVIRIGSRPKCYYMRIGRKIMVIYWK